MNIFLTIVKDNYSGVLFQVRRYFSLLGSVDGKIWSNIYFLLKIISCGVTFSHFFEIKRKNVTKELIYGYLKKHGIINTKIVTICT